MYEPSADPAPPTGYSTLQFGWGGFLDGQPATEAPWSRIHLVPTSEAGAGAILCGLERHPRQTASGVAIPGWSIGGGISGSNVPAVRCEDCAAKRDPRLKVSGLNARLFAATRA